MEDTNIMEKIASDEIITITDGKYGYDEIRFDYNCSTRPLAGFSNVAKERKELPSLVNVIIDVPGSIEEKDVMVRSIGKKLIVKIPGNGRKEIDLPYSVRSEYKTKLEDNTLFILLKRA